MSITTFIDVSMDEQHVELKTYFRSLGAEISEELSSKGLEDDLAKIIGVCDSCFKENNEFDTEGVLTSIVSILIMVPTDRAENLILAFCEKLVKPPTLKIGMISMKVLHLLFQGLNENSAARYHVYYHLVQVASRIGQIELIFTSLENLKQQFSTCQPSNEQMQKLLRLLHDGLVSSQESELASGVMIELLKTYTTENASQAREDAQRCIITSLADPNTFLLDHLLILKPVKFLEGELIHDLLSIFVVEKLASYLQFYENHKEFVNNLGLNHDQNIHKMRLLTFMQLACNELEISFEKVKEELSLNEAEIERFIIDAIRSKLVNARIDQDSKKIHITSAKQRTFGRPQWQQLRDTLLEWKTNLHLVQENLQHLVTAKFDISQPA